MLGTKRKILILAIIASFWQKVRAKIVDDGPWTGYDFELKDPTLTHTLFTIENGVFIPGVTWEQRINAATMIPIGSIENIYDQNNVQFVN